MSEFKHTPEPWTINAYWWIVQADGTQIAIPSVRSADNNDERDANSNRIVACVNGCKGIVDPETTVPELIAALEATSNVIRNILNESQLSTKTSCGVMIRDWSTLVRSTLSKAKGGQP